MEKYESWQSLKISVEFGPIVDHVHGDLISFLAEQEREREREKIDLYDHASNNRPLDKGSSSSTLDKNGSHRWYNFFGIISLV